ncbi:MAG: gamma-glutamyltransferase family protein [Planctomycetota bacterium]|nr:MAG: gamma-glutamyltransferase family protein [Planctomycetota bacterium]
MLALLLGGASLASVACRAAPSAFAQGTRWPTPAHGMVVCQEPRAAAAGARILEQGGNAVDAAVCAALVLAVTHPQAGNLGGGGFALFVPHDPRAQARFLDFRETAPAAITPEDFLGGDGALDAGLARRSVRAAGVPGSPAGLWQLQRELGRLDFAAVAAPAFALARDGFAVGRDLARDLAAPDAQQKLGADDGARAVFYPAGAPLREGQKLVQPALARALDELRQRGPDAFYTGRIAQELAAFHAARGGRLTAEDLASYRTAWRAPLSGWFRGYEIVTAPPPSSGGIALLQVLGILDGFPLDAERAHALAQQRAMQPAGAARAAASTDEAAGLTDRALHWWIEALRLAFVDRAEHLGDPDAWGVPVERLLAPEWIASRRAQIGEQPNPLARALELPRESEETTHISVLDRQGNAVALTTTLNESFGSGILVPELGFLLNNELDDFALVAGTPNAYGLVGGAANALRGGRRPLSSMTPTVLRDNGNTVAFVIGSPGGPRIISSIAEVLLRVLVYGQTLEQAIAAPRLHQQALPARTECEQHFAPALAARLRERGHEIEIVARQWSSVQAIAVEPGGAPIGVSDPRSAGAAVAEER